jgi:hypothetical protein
VANYSGNSITQGGNLSYIDHTVSSVIKAPYALAVNANLSMLYVTNNAQSPKGNFYISTYSTANSTKGSLLSDYFIEEATTGLYGLALSKDNTTLYVSVYSGIAPGVYAGVYGYNLTTKQQVYFVSVNEPWGIAIGSPPPNGTNPTLYDQKLLSYRTDRAGRGDRARGKFWDLRSEIRVELVGAPCGRQPRNFTQRCLCFSGFRSEPWHFICGPPSGQTARNEREARDEAERQAAREREKAERKAEADPGRPTWRG